MYRRSFLASIAALAAMRLANAQRTHKVATLVNGTEKTWGGRVQALKNALKALGYVEGRNLAIRSYWNEAGLERLPAIAGELLLDKPDVVVCGPVLAAAAVQKHSRTVPIVVGNGAGTVKIGLAKSFASPGTNVTGVETLTEELTAKHVELLKTVVPGASRVAVLGTGNYLFHEEAWQAITQAARKLKMTLVDVRVAKVGDPPVATQIPPAVATSNSPTPEHT